MPIFTALVVEDDPDIRTIFTTALRAAGYQVESARDGRVALARLNTSRPDLIVLDVHLPGEVQGGTILSRVRSDPQLTQTRVILATADARTAEMYQSAADLVLVKPVSFVQLRDLAKRLQMA
ncbi:MAG TPA: response regulator [Anaerolineae bacterium]